MHVSVRVLYPGRGSERTPPLDSAINRAFMGTRWPGIRLEVRRRNVTTPESFGSRTLFHVGPKRLSARNEVKRPWYISSSCCLA